MYVCLSINLSWRYRDDLDNPGADRQIDRQIPDVSIDKGLLNICGGGAGGWGCSQGRQPIILIIFIHFFCGFPMQKTFYCLDIAIISIILSIFLTEIPCNCILYIKVRNNDTACIIVIITSSFSKKKKMPL